MSMLVKHVKNDFGERVGTVVALNRDMVGWAQCCPKDKFDKQLGVTIATGRAIFGTKAKPVRVHQLVDHGDVLTCEKVDVISDELEIMKERAKRYFKSA